MKFRYFFVGWSKERIFWFIGLVFTTLLAIFVSLNIGVGEAVKINGTVISVGIDSATRYELSKPLVTVQTDGGRVVIIETQRNISINKGDKVILLKTQQLLTSGAEYKLHRVLP